jgi:hypothetical protein
VYSSTSPASAYTRSGKRGADVSSSKNLLRDLLLITGSVVANLRISQIEGIAFDSGHGIRLVEVSTDVVIGASIFGLLYLTQVVLRPALVIVGGTR